MAKYTLNKQLTPEKIIEYLANEMGDGFEIYSMEIKPKKNRIYIRKNAAIGCTLRHVDEESSMVYFGPFPYWSVWVPLVIIIGFLIIFSVIVTLVTGQFNFVIGGFIPILLTAILIRILSLNIIKQVGSIMKTAKDILN